MAALGIIPARKGSRRFPGKHRVPLLGKPMLAYTLEAAVRAQRLDRLVVSSDNQELRLLAARYGVEFLERPAELASDTASLDEAVRHVCRQLEQRDGFRPDLVVILHGTLPVRADGQIDAVIQRLTELPEATAVCTAQEVRERPEWMKRLLNEHTGEAAPFLSGTFGDRTQDFPRLFRLDGAVLGVRLSVLYAQEGKRNVHAWLGERIHLVVQGDPRYSIDVDYPEQLPLAEFYLLCEQFGERWHDEWAHQHAGAAPKNR